MISPTIVGLNDEGQVVYFLTDFQGEIEERERSPEVWCCKGGFGPHYRVQQNSALQ